VTPPDGASILSEVFLGETTTPPRRAAVSLGAQARRGNNARVVLVIGLFALVFSGVVWGRCGLRGCPNVDRLAAYQPGGAPVLLDRDGRPFADLAPVTADLVPLKSLPRHVVDAFLAVEDRRFYEHRGLDWQRVGGAVLANVRAAGYDEGFSTISMQLARNVFPDRLRARDRTPWRKLMEIRVALEIEEKYGKDEILELYLNHIYFGNGARGLEAAARHYFGVPAARLSLPQAAMLAALPKGPSLYDPRRHAKAARERRDLVLALMEEQDKVEAKEAAAAKKQPVRVVRRRAVAGQAAPFAGWFVEEVRRELEDRFGEDLYEEGLRVHTTLDANAQRAAEEELTRQLRSIESGSLGRFSGPRYAAETPPLEEGTPYLQGAVVMLDSRTGDVLAWVGGRDFRHSRFDRVKDARRQAGSAFKPFVYAAALASGRTLSQHLVDEPLRVALDRRRYWEPKNFDGAFDGPVSLREALVRSKNVPTIRLAESVGYERVAETAEKMGIEGPIDRRPSMPLGTVSVGPLELASAYTVFSTLGEAAVPRFVRRVETPDQEVLWEAEAAEPEPVIEPGIAFLVTDALREALERGTGAAVRAAGFRAPAAGKTGTTNDGTDTWFVGFTPEVVAAVWIGFDKPRPITAVATGGRLAAPVWARLMTRYHAGRSAPGWTPPSGVFQATVDPATGLILAEGCQPQTGAPYREFFVRGLSPPSVCPSRGVPVEMLAGLERPLPDDEEATDLSMGLPPELLPAEQEEDDAGGVETVEETDGTESEGEASPRAAGESEADAGPSPEPPASATPAPGPAATPSPRPTPAPTPEPAPEATPEPAATPAPTPTPPPS
jgi:penicillin-binding protein 1A